LNIEENKEKNEINEKIEDDDEAIMSESLFQYCLDKDMENIIYYILNQGYDPFKAIYASLSCRKYNFCIILLERFDAILSQKFKAKNSRGQTLIHILCNRRNDENNKFLIEKIYSILTKRINININQFDNYKHTPLYYAVLNNNFTLIYLLTDDMDKNKYYLFLEKDKKNNNNFSPLMLLYHKINSSSGNELGIILNIIFKVTQHLKIGYFNNVVKYLLKNYSSESKNNYSYDDSNLNQIINLFNYLINSCNIDVNKDIDDKGNNIFFLSAIKNNFDLFNNILIKRKNINYNKTNKEGKSLIHYIVSLHPLYSYKNIKFLKAAVDAGFNPNIKDKDGLTPLDYAKKNNFIDMLTIISPQSKIDKQSLKAEIKENIMDIEEELKDNKINYNYKEVSNKYYNEIIKPYIKRNIADEDITKSLVTEDCELIVSNYHVYKDDNDCLYNANLSKVKINKYVYGEFLFYHMQLLVNDKRRMYNLITRWGRFGEDGQYQNTPFTDINEAIEEYNKIFSSKTGNKWDNIKKNANEFQRKPKKYHLLNLTNEKPEIYNIMKYFNLELKNILMSVNQDNLEKYENNMNPNTKELIHYLIKIAIEQKVGGKHETKGIYNILYFSKESLDKGYKILSELALLNDRSIELKHERENIKISEKNLEDENSPYNKNIREFHEISQKILDLSNTYYEIIPFEDERKFSVTPIDKEKIIKEELERLQSYTYIEDTLKLFLSSLYYIKNVDSISYIYKVINKKIIPLNLDLYSDDNKDKKIVQILINYINLTKNRGYITNIFEIMDKNENKFGYHDEKRILLFHGTKTQNMLGILSKGLLIAPIESKSSGNRFGSGIYLSDSFQKSLNYTSNEDKKYVLMVDTLLDKVYKINDKNQFTNVKDIKKKGYNCLINDSRRHISFENKIYLNNGLVVPTEMIEEKRERRYDFNIFSYDSYDSVSEYVIYDPKLVNVKYIIELEN
jgi:predicted DNA-binding WGR domain protein